MIEIRKIKVAENLELPFRCDLNVLDMIQRRYGTVVEFEKKIVDYKFIEENGELKKVKKEPDIGAIAFALPIMIMEGMEIESEVTGKVYDITSKEQLIANIERDFKALAKDIHAELSRCFRVKK